MSKIKNSLPISPVVLVLALLLVGLLGLFVFSSKHYSRGKYRQNAYERSSKQAIQSTNSWKIYEDNQESYSIKYPKNWEVETVRVEHGKVVFLNPSSVKNNSDKIKIFVMDNGYFGIDGLPTKSIVVNGVTGLMVDEGLYGFVHNNKYITLDAGNASGARTFLSSMVQTLSFR